MEENISFNIQPQAGVLGAFSRLNYKPWYAIAEFVDNSTQSFYSHEDELKAHGIDSVEIRINYDPVVNVLTIVDTAFGMEINDFLRAVKVDSPPEVNSGRNEFGMGLKTAASWFGNVWAVESTQYGSTNHFSTVIDIEELRRKNINDINIKKTSVEPESHGTKIIISSITKRIDASRTKGKIITLLESMYRRDLHSGKVRIIYDDDYVLQFDGYDCLRFRNTTWRKDVDFQFEFNGAVYPVKGFVGILANGGFGRAGFALFRRGRVIVGGEDQNYKPDFIFGQAQSTISHKLFGELDLEAFPVNQAKDGFVWDDGLEDAFLQRLRKDIRDYIDIAKLTNKDRAKEESLSETVSNSIQSSIQEQIDKVFNSENNLLPGEEYQDILSVEDKSISAYREYQREQNSTQETISDQVRSYSISINPYQTCKIDVRWSIGDNSSWISVDLAEDSSSASIKLNINHPFFKPFSEKEEFKAVLEKFAIAFALSEISSKAQSPKDGYIPVSMFRNFINQYLKELSSEE